MSSASSIEYYREALSFLATQKDQLPFERLFGGTYSLAEIPQAMERMHRLEEIKPVVDPFK